MATYFKSCSFTEQSDLEVLACSLMRSFQEYARMVNSKEKVPEIVRSYALMRRDRCLELLKRIDSDLADTAEERFNG